MVIGYPGGMEIMDINTVKGHIKQKQFDPMYIFTGPEWMGQKIYIEQISKVTGYEIKRIPSISTVFVKLKNRSFVDKNYIYVVRDDKEFMTNEKLQSNIKTALGNNIFILILTTVDKRLKFYKQYKDSIVEFEPFNSTVLTKYIQREIPLSEKCCQTLIDICENDYGRILLEVDKIKQYAKAGNHSNMNGVFAHLVDSGTLYRPAKDAIFDFVEAVMCRSSKCWYLLYESYAVGEANMVLLSVLYNNIKQTLQVQSYHGNDLSKSTGLTGWQIQCAKKHLNKYRDEELIRGMRLLQKIESGIKTGKIEDEVSVEYFLVNFL